MRPALQPDPEQAWQTAGTESEAVMQAELQLPRRGTHAAYLAKVAVGYAVVRIPITGNVEDVKEIGAETDNFFMPHVEVFEQ